MKDGEDIKGAGNTGKRPQTDWRRKTEGKRPSARAVLAATLLTIPALVCLGGCTGPGHPELTGAIPTGEKRDSLQEISGPVSLLTALYRGPLNHLEAVRPGSCPMHPTCSRYAKEVLETHNELTAWFLICDRLMRCGRDEIRLGPVIQTPQGPRILDPPPG